MDTERNEHQIIRKDARACFVETLNDSFEFGKVHFCFVSYDMKLPAGQRQTNTEATDLSASVWAAHPPRS